MVNKINHEIDYKIFGKYCAISRNSIGFARKSKRQILRLYDDGA